jgi:N-acetylneuraminic acid mutarotase
VAASLLVLLAAACGSKGPATAPISGEPGATVSAPAASAASSASAQHTRPPSFRIASAFRIPVPLQRSVAVDDSGTLYLAGGLDSNEQSTRDVYSIDPSTGKASRVGRFPQAFHDAAGALIGGKLFVFGGGPLEGTDVVQSFDPASGQTAIAGHLPVVLSDLSAATIGGTVYLVGGYDGKTPQDEIYATTDGTKFRAVGKLPTGLRYAGVAAVGSNLIIAGGVSSAGTVDSVYSFDTQGNGKVTQIGRLPAPIAHASVFALDGTVYVVGGADASDTAAVGSVTSVDPANGHTQVLAPLRKAVSDSAVAAAPGEAWMMGGLNGHATDRSTQATL